MRDEMRGLQVGLYSHPHPVTLAGTPRHVVYDSTQILENTGYIANSCRLLPLRTRTSLIQVF